MQTQERLLPMLSRLLGAAAAAAAPALSASAQGWLEPAILFGHRARRGEFAEIVRRYFAAQESRTRTQRRDYVLPMDIMSHIRDKGFTGGQFRWKVNQFVVQKHVGEWREIGAITDVLSKRMAEDLATPPTFAYCRSELAAIYARVVLEHGSSQPARADDFVQAHWPVLAHICNGFRARWLVDTWRTHVHDAGLHAPDFSAMEAFLRERYSAMREPDGTVGEDFDSFRDANKLTLETAWLLDAWVAQLAPESAQLHRPSLQNTLKLLHNSTDPGRAGKADFASMWLWHRSLCFGALYTQQILRAWARSKPQLSDAAQGLAALRTAARASFASYNDAGGVHAGIFEEYWENHVVTFRLCLQRLARAGAGA